MPTQSHSKFRLLIVVLAAALPLGVLAGLTNFEPHHQVEVTQRFPAKAVELVGYVQSDNAEAPVANIPITEVPMQPMFQSTRLLSTGILEKITLLLILPTSMLHRDAPDIEVDPLLSYNEHQVSLEMSMLIFLLQDGDLLANHCLNGCREFVTEQQVLEAQLLTKQYAAKLKEIRRQRAAVLEQAGVTIDDPEKELALIRIKAFSVYSEAKHRIFQEVLKAEQRKSIAQKFQTIQREARRTKAAKQSAQETKVCLNNDFDRFEIELLKICRT